MSSLRPKYFEIAVDQLELDLGAARAGRLTDNLQDAWLLESIRKWGVLSPIAVDEFETGRYRIIDGQRRYLCAKELQLIAIPCMVHCGLSEIDRELLRLVLQDTDLPLTQQERRNLVRKLRQMADIEEQKGLDAAA